jgi:hypothetical protein
MVGRKSNLEDRMPGKAFHIMRRASDYVTGHSRKERPWRNMIANIGISAA